MSDKKQPAQASEQEAARPPAASALGWLAAAWGLGGVGGLLGQALWRLTPIAVEGVANLTTTAQRVVLVGWVLLNAHAEGYRGFHRRFSPRVIARAMHLARRPTALRGALAPLFCMSLFGASRRGQIVARCLLVGIVLLVALVRRLPQPWRGIIDAGVVVGLGLGVLSVGYHAARAALGRPPPIDADLPPGEA